MDFNKRSRFSINTRDGVVHFDGRVVSVGEILANRVLWLSSTSMVLGLFLTVIFIGIPILGAGLIGLASSRILRKTRIGSQEEQFDLSMIRGVSVIDPKRWPFGRLTLDVIESNGPAQREFVFPWHQKEEAHKLKQQIEDALPNRIYQD